MALKKFVVRYNNGEEVFSHYGVEVWYKPAAVTVWKNNNLMWLLQGENLMEYFDNICSYIKKHEGLCPLEDVNNVVYAR